MKTNIKPNAVTTHPLIGAGLHYRGADDEVIHQAFILDVVSSGSTTTGDLALVQYLDWGWGNPSTRRLVPLADMAASDRWVLYADTQEMSEHFERVDSARNEHIRARRPAPIPASAEPRQTPEINR